MTASDGLSIEMTEIGKDEYDDLLVLWEASVRATHDFLAEADIRFLRPVVKHQALPHLTLRGARDGHGNILGFIGIAGDSVEALFVSPEAFGKGIGKTLMACAENEFGTTRVDVNEQNPRAVGFYRHLGYQESGRSPLDGQGRPFPILHLEKRQ